MQWSRYGHGRDGQAGEQEFWGIVHDGLIETAD